jgi:hypothetical protein
MDLHCNQVYSTLGGEVLVQARTMGYKVRCSSGNRSRLATWVLPAYKSTLLVMPITHQDLFALCLSVGVFAG